MSSLNLYQPQKETAPSHFTSCLVIFSFGIDSWKHSLPASLGSWDQGWYNISKFFRPLPLSTLKNIYKFIYFNWRLITLQYCIGFAIHQHEPAMGVYVCLWLYFPYLKLVLVHGPIYLKTWNLFFHRYQDCQKGSWYTNRIGWNNH